jgi:DNA-binding IscR family transcriptional regulator
MWQRVEQAIFAVLDSITLLDLVEQMARNNCPEISPDME